MREAGPGLAVLKRRRDFLAASRARKAQSPGFALQARDRGEARPGPPRVGFTASKKVGGAVARNRAKRRLRALVRQNLALAARPGWDYVLIARCDATASRTFALLESDLAAALVRVHAEQRRRAPRS